MLGTDLRAAAAAVCPAAPRGSSRTRAERGSGALEPLERRKSGAGASGSSRSPTENWSKGMRKIKCACLQPRGNGIYTVDPRWKGDSNKAADKATIALIFEVMGEGLRQMPDGFEGEPAWKLTTVRRQ